MSKKQQQENGATIIVSRIEKEATALTNKIKKDTYGIIFNSTGSKPNADANDTVSSGYLLPPWTRWETTTWGTART